MKKLLAILSLGAMFTTINLSARGGAMPGQNGVEVSISDKTNKEIVTGRYPINFVTDPDGSISVGSMKQQIIDEIHKQNSQILCCVSASLSLVQVGGKRVLQDDGHIVNVRMIGAGGSLLSFTATILGYK